MDGLQRLTALKRFILDGSLQLEGLEFLATLQGKTFSQLPRSYQRRIEETQVTVFVIQENTPPQVKFNIFKRINTAACLFRHRKSAMLFIPCCGCSTGRACSVSRVQARHRQRDSRRSMGDRECVLRGLAFMLLKPESYRAGELDSFLNRAMSEINALKDSDVIALKSRFMKALDLAKNIFGSTHSRKQSMVKRIDHPLTRPSLKYGCRLLAICPIRRPLSRSRRRLQIKERFSHLLTPTRDSMQQFQLARVTRRRFDIGVGKVASLLNEVLNAE